MAYTFIISASGGSTNTNDVTTGAVNTTGADFLVMSISSYAGAADQLGTPAISDSKANTWTVLTPQDSGATHTRTVLAYAANAIVGAAHTFTASLAGSFPSIFVMALSGSQLLAPFDSQNGNHSGGVTSIQPGSITPGASNELIVSGFSDDAAFGALAIDSGFTLQEQVALSGGNHFGGAIAYLIQGAAAAINPTWSWTTAGAVAATIASFKAAAGGGGGSTKVGRITGLIDKPIWPTIIY